MPMVEGAGVALHWEDARPPATGPATVLVHDIASDAAGQAARAQSLAARGRRVVVYDRRGYGASGAPEPYVGTTVAEQGLDLAALVRRLDLGPALLAGEGFGALIALEVARRDPALVAGVVAVDPLLLALVPEATESLSAQRLLLEETLREGGPRAAVADWVAGLHQLPGAQAPPAEPPAEADVARAQDAYVGFFADYAGLASWEITRRELRALATPVTLVTGPASPAAVVLAADRLAELLPDVRRAPDGDVVAAVLAR